MLYMTINNLFFSGVRSMPISGDNPLGDGLDFVGCPPQPTKLKLSEFPENFKGESKLIC